MKTVLPLVLIAAFVAFPAGAAQKKSNAKADHHFLDNAATGGMMEVELGRVATQNAASDRVKQFGQRMVDDHSKANDDLKQVAGRKDVKLPATLSRDQKKQVDRLSKLHGEAFDRAYMNAMVDDHEKDVAEFRREAKSANDPDVKEFASRTLPTLENHLKMAKDVAGQTGTATSGTRRHPH